VTAARRDRGLDLGAPHDFVKLGDFADNVRIKRPAQRNVNAHYWSNGGSPRQGVRAAARTKLAPESLPRKRSPIWSCVRATDRRSLLRKEPGRFGGEADDDFGRDTFATADISGEAVFSAEAWASAGIGGEADDEFVLGACCTASAAGEAAFNAGAEASIFPETRAADGSDGSIIAVLATKVAFSDAGETWWLAGAKSGKECRSTCLRIAFPPIATESADRTAPT
jgi:hypothetical protein